MSSERVNLKWSHVIWFYLYHILIMTKWEDDEQMSSCQGLGKVGERCESFIVFKGIKLTLKISLFIRLHWVLNVACKLLSFGMWTLKFRHVGSTPLTRDQTSGPLNWEHGVLATGPPGKSLSMVMGEKAEWEGATQTGRWGPSLSDIWLGPTSDSQRGPGSHQEQPLLPVILPLNPPDLLKVCSPVFRLWTRAWVLSEPLFPPL